MDGIGSAQKRKSRGDDQDEERFDKRARMDESAEPVLQTSGMNPKRDHICKPTRPSLRAAFPSSNSLPTNGTTNMEVEPLTQGSKMESEMPEVVASDIAVVPKVNPVHFMKGHDAEVSLHKL